MNHFIIAIFKSSWWRLRFSFSLKWQGFIYDMCVCVFVFFSFFAEKLSLYNCARPENYIKNSNQIQHPEKLTTNLPIYHTQNSFFVNTMQSLCKIHIHTLVLYSYAITLELLEMEKTSFCEREFFSLWYTIAGKGEGGIKKTTDNSAQYIFIRME